MLDLNINSDSLVQNILEEGLKNKIISDEDIRIENDDVISNNNNLNNVIPDSTPLVDKKLESEIENINVENQYEKLLKERESLVMPSINEEKKDVTQIKNQTQEQNQTQTQLTVRDKLKKYIEIRREQLKLMNEKKISSAIETPKKIEPIKQIQNSDHMAKLEELKKKDEKDHIRIFSEIYMNKVWGDNNNSDYLGSSGSGSTLISCLYYVKYMRNFIRNNKIKKVVDLGCGDWQHSYYIYKDFDLEYVGYDAYETVIERNRKIFTNSSWKFNYLDFYKDREQIEDADVCIIKDVLQHWSNKEVTNLLDLLTKNNKFKYIVIVNNNYQQSDNQEITKTGEFRGLSMKYLPLKRYNPKFLFNFGNKEASIIFLN